FGETGGALGAPSTRSHAAGNHPAFSPTCAAVLLGARSRDTPLLVPFGGVGPRVLARLGPGVEIVFGRYDEAVTRQAILALDLALGRGVLFLGPEGPVLGDHDPLRTGPDPRRLLRPPPRAVPEVAVASSAHVHHTGPSDRGAARQQHLDRSSRFELFSPGDI